LDRSGDDDGVETDAHIVMRQRGQALASVAQSHGGIERMDGSMWERRAFVAWLLACYSRTAGTGIFPSILPTPSGNALICALVATTKPVNK